MKTLIISVKPVRQAMDEVWGRLEKTIAKRGKVTPHYEISFTDLKQFKKFIANVDMLTVIKRSKPKSIYELASIMKKDVANVSRTVNFFERMGVISLKDKVVGGRSVRTPIVDYQKIEFDLVF